MMLSIKGGLLDRKKDAFSLQLMSGVLSQRFACHHSIDIIEDLLSWRCKCPAYVSFTSCCTGVNVCDTNQIARRRFKAVETVVRALAPSVELSKESGFFLIIGGIQVAMVRNGSKNPGFIIYIYSQTYKTLYNVKLIFEQNIKSAEMTLVCQLNLSRRHDHTTDRLGNTNASATPT